MQQIKRKAMVVLLMFSFLTELIYASENNSSKDENITNNYDALNAVKDLFEPMFNTHITSITDVIITFSTLFGAIVTLLMVFGAAKIYKVSEDINKNKDQIFDLKSKIIERVNDISLRTKDEIDKIEKWTFNQREKDITKIENEIENR